MQGLNDDEFEALLDNIEAKEKARPRSDLIKTVKLTLVEKKPLAQVAIATVSPIRINGPAYFTRATEPDLKTKSTSAVTKSPKVRSKSVGVSSKQLAHATMSKSVPVNITPQSDQGSQQDRLEALIEELKDVSVPPPKFVAHPEISMIAMAHNHQTDLINREVYIPADSVRTSRGKCGVVKVGGSKHPRGANSSVGGMVLCDALSCTDCDHRVLQVQDSVWTGLIDYMFLRNNYPSLSRLSIYLKKDLGSAAYCCQCSWLSVNKVEDVPKLKWRCSGH